MSRLRRSLARSSFLLNGFCAHAGGVVTAATEENLRAALVGGGNVSFAVDGKISLSSTLITNNTTMDATEHSVGLGGGGAVRVLQGATRVCASSDGPYGRP